ncbi:putative intron-encoded endonuclease [Botrytis fragariae]|uniref:Cytochrome b n=1 Tax=Botrytis fragariae TaxID=1964551 RepID=A0A8H6AJ86_9HELO|nr:putative intron-encoded endonuclease [Botrytis fragariae]XP_037187356.1 putative intron-encoded endonuclease [Botrytis fragariae]KAF5868387.1 putative intron-encoded endonuclease [Botrytis fragariae]KAF5868407.1 putative intron-encoded endonuclease [Botrytis fragariae]
MIVTAFLGYKHSPKWFNINNKGNTIKYNKVNSNKLFNKSRVKRGYCTSCDSNSTKVSESLSTVISELGLNPIYLYENLNLENTRKQVLKDTRDLSGIYMIVNKTTKDYYIGSASTNRFYARFCNHLIYFRGSKIVKLAVKKYDLKNFAFLILDLYPNVVTQGNNKELMDLEDKYLKLLVPNYNILTEAGSSFGYKHTEVDRNKMKDIYSDARRERIGNLNKGKKLSPETIERIREKALIRPAMSEETKSKCITNTRPVVLYNLNRTVYGKYSTILEAAKAINCRGFSVNNATLNRFFALHFVLPFVLAALALMHLIALHDSAGSGNPLGISGNYDRLAFAPYFLFKDLITIFLFIIILSIFVFFMPNVLGDSVIAMLSAILILLAMPFTDLSRSRGIQFRPLSKIAFYIFIANFLILMVLGAKHVESPYIEFGQISTVIYFAHFLIIVPFISLLENSLVELAVLTKEKPSR